MDAGADCATVHAGWGNEEDDAVDALVDAVLEASARYDVPIYFETHRATLTQDVLRTRKLIERWPNIRFNGDFSHYYCGHEMGYRGFETTRHDLAPILARCSFLHGRVSDGQRMQSDLDDPATDPHTENFSWLWREAMRGWLRDAAPGATLPFAPELGPPSLGYAATLPDRDGGRLELCERWAQTLTLGEIARRCFGEAGHVDERSN